MPHVIMTQVFDLSIDKMLDSFSIQQKISALNKDEILPLLEKLFDGLSDEQEMICVDELEIDLGIFREEELSRRFITEKILSMITAQVQDKIRTGLYQSDAGIRKELRMLNIFRQWIFYMQKGYLPWNASRPDESWYQQVLEAGATDHQSIELLRELLTYNPEVVERIVFLHSPAYLSHIIELLTAEKQDGLLQLPDELEKVNRYISKGYANNEIVQRIRIVQSVWKAILRMAAVWGDPAGLSSFSITRQLIADNFTELQILRVAASGTLLAQLTLSAAAWQELAHSYGKTVTNPSHHGNQGDTGPGNDDIKILTSKENYPVRNKTEQIEILRDIIQGDVISPDGFPAKSNITREHLKNQITEEGIFTGQAGLVILHPFLYPFMKNMALVKDGNYINLAAQQQALQLLHYMATGDSNWDEHTLLMAKILCDYPLQEPVNSAVVPLADHFAGADELLRAVIGQWEALKNPSIAALQESFLQREGMLVSKNDNYHLLVERTGIDILLDRLPWSINYVKLPWMKKILSVEWTK